MGSSSWVSSVPIPFWRIAADLTCGGVFTCGILAIVNRENPRWFVPLVVVAGLLDGIDGAFARQAGGPSAYGATLDVIADMVAFCVAPAALVLAQPRFQEILPLTLTLLFVYALASLYRLIRSRRTYTIHKHAFCGLPMPTVGALVTGMCLTLPVPLFFAGMLLTSLLAISRWPYPRLAWLWRSDRILLVSMIALEGILLTISLGAALLLAWVYAVYPWLGRSKLSEKEL